MLRRTYLIARQEFAFNLRRPMFWFWFGSLAFVIWGMASGSLKIQTSGDSSVGGTKQWLTSEFSFAQLVAATNMILSGFFIAIAAGMTVIRDEDLNIPQLLQSTPLTVGQYIWGKFLGNVATFVLMMLLHILAAVFFFHVLPSSTNNGIRGPLEWTNYFRAMLVFGLPTTLFFAGISFAAGERFRRPILVFVLPTILLLVFGLILNSWSPDWLPKWVDRALMLIDPYGNRWLTETWLKVDLGAEFYNTQRIGLDTGFVLSRIGFAIAGLVPVLFAKRHYARTLRMMKHGSLSVAQSEQIANQISTFPQTASITTLGMKSKIPGLLSATLTVTRFELLSLRSHPGLYLFVPFIILQTIGVILLNQGVFQTQVLQTPGTLAMNMMNTLTVLVCMLLLFYSVESRLREQKTGLAPIFYSSSTGSAAILFGKTLANAFIGVVILLATFIACMILLGVQGIVPISIWPFLFVWGLLLVPTFIVWSAFVSLLLSVTRNRYTTYALAAGVLGFTFYRQFTGKMNWVGNWNLWSIGRWSDISKFELDGNALMLNRLMVLSLAVFFTYATVKLFDRRSFDAIRIMHRLRPFSLFKLSLKTLPFAIPSLVLGSALWYQVHEGYQGKSQKDKQKDYWKQNLATFKDAKSPAITVVDLSLELKPEKRWFGVEGFYELTNKNEETLRQIALTVGFHWEKMSWTLNDEPYEPEDRSRLMVFTLDKPLAPGESVKIGFSHQGRFLDGISKNGGGVSQFILPSCVVLHSFTPSFVPVVGYIDAIGVDDENRYEGKRYDKNYFEGVTPPLFGGGDSFRTEIRVTGPADFVFNSVGILEDSWVNIETGLKTWVWKSDHPVSFINVVGGHWDVHKKGRIKIFYDKKHNYNIEEISLALESALKYYSEWFAPYPWKELKLSEFANLATYAQGFPTNITFSEGIGFLTKKTAGADAPFLVTAHESAHQWWGNMLVPGKGPGGNILSEGMAHFSTGLLMEQVKGLGGRIEFFDKIEKNYNERRSPDAERPLIEIDGNKRGDTTVTYDKGGWVFWMLLNQMGRERALKGIQNFIGLYSNSVDHPVLQDFLKSMRPFANDKKAFDDFVAQWFFKVVLPQYKLEDVAREKIDDGRWKVTATVTNAGTGKMPVEVAVTNGDRFDTDRQPTDNYRDARTTITLGEGESLNIVIECEFEPVHLLMDPDRLVLQLKRKLAQYEF